MWSLDRKRINSIREHHLMYSDESLRNKVTPASKDILC